MGGRRGGEGGVGGWGGRRKKLPTDGPDHTTRPKGHHSGQE